MTAPDEIYYDPRDGYISGNVLPDHPAFSQCVAYVRTGSLSDPIAVHANMLRGTIAKPTVEQIIHLYGVDALVKALAPVIVQEAEKIEYERKVAQMKEDFPNGI
jgi:hypothetical protein